MSAGFSEQLPFRRQHLATSFRATSNRGSPISDRVGTISTRSPIRSQADELLSIAEAIMPSLICNTRSTSSTVTSSGSRRDWPSPPPHHPEGIAWGSPPAPNLTFKVLGLMFSSALASAAAPHRLVKTCGAAPVSYAERDRQRFRKMRPRWPACEKTAQEAGLGSGHRVYS